MSELIVYGPPSFTDHYDDRGRLLSEPDDGKLELRRHCSRCGAFLPKKPEEETQMVPADWHYLYSDEGEIKEVIVTREVPEMTWTWTCTKCGHIHDGEEMYE